MTHARLQAPLFLTLLATVIGAGGEAHAHGTIPTANTVSFGPGTGGVLLGTNFGGIWRRGDVDAGGDDRFLCERGVTGEQQSVDVWLWLPSGVVTGIVTTGGFIRGVYQSSEGVGGDESGCGFAIVPGTDQLLMADITPDPSDPSGFLGVGATSGDAAEARLVRRGSDGHAVTLTTAPGAVATGVRASGEHVYAVFIAGTKASIVHRHGNTEEWFTVVREGNDTLRPLGIDPRAPETVWLVMSGEAGDVLLRSEDAGETRVPVLTINARLGGFAIDGDRVWVQSARHGIHASSDGGKSFTLLADSPHGTCLARDAAGVLWACGVPWQDGMALGRQRPDGGFEPVIPFYDDIVGALVCADAPAVTSLCDDELDFLRDYYGFADPGAGDGAGPETVESVEATESVAEAVEPGPEPTPDTAAEALTEPARPSDDGCAGGAAEGRVALSALALAWLVASRRARRTQRR